PGIPLTREWITGHHGVRNGGGGGPLRACWVLLSVLLSLLAGAGAARADGGAGDPCHSAWLAGERAEASISLDHRNRTHTKVTTRLKVRVPSGWPYASGLLMGEESEEYRRAVRCLTRGPESHTDRWSERREGLPRVTPGRDGIDVEVPAYTWVDSGGPRPVGPWQLTAGATRWEIRFTPSPALGRADWKRVTVDPGAPGAETASPPPARGEGGTTLVWEPPDGRAEAPAVRVVVKPAWQRSWAARYNDQLFFNASYAGELLWDIGLLAAVLYGARRTRGSGAGAPAESRALRNLVVTVWCTFLLLRIVDGDDVFFHLPSVDVGHEPLISLATTGAVGLTLLLLGRPRRTVLAAGLLLCALPLAVLVSPGSFGLDEGFDVPGNTSYGAGAALAAAAWCLLCLGFLGVTAAVWRPARDCGLLGDRPPRVPGGPPGPRRLRLRVAGPLVALAALGVGASYATATERDWLRTSWPSDRTDAYYGMAHLADAMNEIGWFTPNAQNWWFNAFWWLPATLALLALLRARAHRPGSSPIAPEGPDHWWVLVFFPLGVVGSFGWFTANGALTWLWLPVTMGALHLAVASGRRRAVLEQPLERSGVPLGAAIGEADRVKLLDRARRFREIHAQLRRLDQGQSDDEAHSRRAFERELRGMHHWNAPSGRADRLPGAVSVVDAALAWGPRATWWGNGRHAAARAALWGLPATGLLVWADMLRGEFLTGTLDYGFGIPDMVAAILYWEIGWAGAGFVLGVLWRRLPGRRGLVKALPVAAAYAVPVGADAVGNLLTGESQYTLALYVSAMLLVLSVTGIGMDLATFRGERRYWQSGLGLLLSVYQMRAFSLQMASVLAQVIALVTIWQFFGDQVGAPPQELGNQHGPLPTGQGQGGQGG
ncbi:DUF6185 family protein, partial [Streptomyces lycii]